MPLELVNQSQIARMADIHKTTVEEWYAAGKLPAVHATLGGRRLWLKADIAQMLEDGRLGKGLRRVA